MSTDADRAIAAMLQARSDAAASTERFEQSVADAYRAVGSLRKVAAALGMTVEGVRRLLQRNGVELRPPHTH